MSPHPSPLTPNPSLFTPNPQPSELTCHPLQRLAFRGSPPPSLPPVSPEMMTADPIRQSSVQKPRRQVPDIRRQVPDTVKAGTGHCVDSTAASVPDIAWPDIIGQYRTSRSRPSMGQ
eukprot:2154812-Rhodomonas_salina.2